MMLPPARLATSTTAVLIGAIDTWRWHATSESTTGDTLEEMEY